MKRIRIVLITLCLLAMAYSGYKILNYKKDSNKTINTYKELSEEVLVSEDSINDRFPVIDFETLEEKNKDIVGWIILENSPINYPVMQGKDNDYYLRKLFDLSYADPGSIFMDYKNMKDLSNHHTIVYGHHMYDDTMFSVLVNYVKQDFYEENKELLYLTKDKNYYIKVFSSYLTDVEDDAWRLDFQTEQEFIDWLEDKELKSAIKTDIKPTSKDHIITLSSCGFEYQGARYVVHGVLTEE